MSESPSRAVNESQDRRRTRKALRGRFKSTRGFSQLVHAYWQSEEYARLSPRAVKLLVDLTAQYRGSNNGDLTTAWSVMRKVGWRSKHLLSLARRELERRGWILLTHQGGRHSPTLYALTFEGINDCRDSQGNKKFDVGIKPDPMPLHLWRQAGYADLPVERSKRSFKNKSLTREPGKPFPRAGKGAQENTPKVTDLAPYLSRVSVQCA